MNVEAFFKLDKAHVSALKRLGIQTTRDLLYYFPQHYGGSAQFSNIENLEKGAKVTVFGTISSLRTKKSFRGGVPMSEATIADGTGSIKAVWFNQPYIAKMIKDGSPVRLDGAVSVTKAGKRSMTNPHIEVVSEIPVAVGDSLFGPADEESRLYPTYPLTKGITSTWIYYAIQKIFKAELHKDLVDPIPQDILDRYSLPGLHSAFVFIHTPKKESDALAARKRFAFEEVFLIQLKKMKDRAALAELPSFVIEPSEEEMSDFVDRFPFKPTEAQQSAIADILKDFRRGHPMSRLVEGDVGSGKTAVAATAVYAATVTRPDAQYDFGNVQTAYMVPTEILAKQQFENFIHYFRHTGVKIALITSSGCKKFPSKANPDEATDISRTQLLKWVASGEIPIVVGTHSLIQKSVAFKNLGLVIIDEQHRFGTVQRQKIARKDNFAPHLLSMTATPIPRTLALTIYGDLDLSVINQLPAGRKPIITKTISLTERTATYAAIRKELEAERQMYVICPRIDEADPSKESAILAKSVKEEAKRLKEEVFQQYNIAVMHGKLTPKEKEDVMTDFETGKIDILVSTSVVEVGVNVPNATVMIIEGAERFGLAQLHQLRGRIARSSHQGYCYMFTDSKTETTLKRLGALEKAKDGFELAEYDLQLRGSGELSGRKQWGVSDVGMEAIKNLKMVEAARNEARDIIEKDPELANKNNAILAAVLAEKPDIHFE